MDVEVGPLITTLPVIHDCMAEVRTYADSVILALVCAYILGIVSTFLSVALMRTVRTPLRKMPSDDDA